MGVNRIIGLRARRIERLQVLNDYLIKLQNGLLPPNQNETVNEIDELGDLIQDDDTLLRVLDIQSNSNDDRIKANKSGGRRKKKGN